MHILQASLVGAFLWAAGVAAIPSIYTIACGPLIVSAVAVLLSIITT